MEMRKLPPENGTIFGRRWIGKMATIEVCCCLSRMYSREEVRKSFSFSLLRESWRKKANKSVFAKQNFSPSSSKNNINLILYHQWNDEDTGLKHCGLVFILLKREKSDENKARTQKEGKLFHFIQFTYFSFKCYHKGREKERKKLELRWVV
jgi:hypothetical protein